MCELVQCYGGETHEFPTTPRCHGHTHTHLFGHANEVWSDHGVHVDTLQLEVGCAADHEQVQQFTSFVEEARVGHTSSRTARGSSQPMASAVDHATVVKDEESEQLAKDVEAALELISKTHGEWGRRNRDAKAVVCKCRNNIRTQSSVVLNELEDMIKTGDELDSSLVALETS